LVLIWGAALLGAACSAFSSDDDPVAPPPDGSGTEVIDSGGDTASEPEPADAADAADAVPARDAQFSITCDPAKAPCTTLNDVCCYDPSKLPAEARECARQNDSCPAATDSKRYRCDDEDDCIAVGQPNLVCCGTLAGLNPNYLATATCKTRLNCAVGQQDVRLCNPAVDSQCPAGKTCVEVKTYPPLDDAGPLVEVRPSFFACQR